MADIAKLRKRLPAKISSLYDPKFAQMYHDKVMAECKNVSIQILQSLRRKQITWNNLVLQSESLLWFEHHKGQITASHFSSMFHTSLDSQFSSLISGILQQKPIPDVAVLKWGGENEPLAKQQYIAALSNSRSFFKVEQTGLCINLKYPYLGASPDGRFPIRNAYWVHFPRR